jgi:hypothetical protein
MTNRGIGLRRMDDAYYANCMTMSQHRRTAGSTATRRETVRMAQHVP